MNIITSVYAENAPFGLEENAIYQYRNSLINAQHTASQIVSDHTQNVFANAILTASAITNTTEKKIAYLSFGSKEASGFLPKGIVARIIDSESDVLKIEQIITEWQKYLPAHKITELITKITVSNTAPTQGVSVKVTYTKTDGKVKIFNYNKVLFDGMEANLNNTYLLSSDVFINTLDPVSNLTSDIMRKIRDKSFSKPLASVLRNNNTLENCAGFVLLDPNTYDVTTADTDITKQYGDLLGYGMYVPDYAYEGVRADLFYALNGKAKTNEEYQYIVFELINKRGDTAIPLSQAKNVLNFGSWQFLSKVFKGSNALLDAQAYQMSKPNSYIGKLSDDFVPIRLDSKGVSSVNFNDSQIVLQPDGVINIIDLPFYQKINDNGQSVLDPNHGLIHWLNKSLKDYAVQTNQTPVEISAKEVVTHMNYKLSDFWNEAAAQANGVSANNNILLGTQIFSKMPLPIVVSLIANRPSYETERLLNEWQRNLPYEMIKIDANNITGIKLRATNAANNVKSQVYYVNASGSTAVGYISLNADDIFTPDASDIVISNSADDTEIILGSDRTITSVTAKSWIASAATSAANSAAATSVVLKRGSRIAVNIDERVYSKTGTASYINGTLTSPTTTFVPGSGTTIGYSLANTIAITGKVTPRALDIVEGSRVILGSDLTITSADIGYSVTNNGQIFPVMETDKLIVPMGTALNIDPAQAAIYALSQKAKQTISNRSIGAIESFHAPANFTGALSSNNLPLIKAAVSINANGFITSFDSVSIESAGSVVLLNANNSYLVPSDLYTTAAYDSSMQYTNAANFMAGLNTVLSTNTDTSKNMGIAVKNSITSYWNNSSKVPQIYCVPKLGGIKTDKSDLSAEMFNQINKGRGLADNSYPYCTFKIATNNNVQLRSNTNVQGSGSNDWWSINVKYFKTKEEALTEQAKDAVNTYIGQIRSDLAHVYRDLNSRYSIVNERYGIGTETSINWMKGVTTANGKQLKTVDIRFKWMQDALDCYAKQNSLTAEKIIAI